MTLRCGATRAFGALVAVGLATSTLLVSTGARAAEIDNGSEGLVGSDGVVLNVEIAPRACEPNCVVGGGSGGGGGALPATGLELSGAVLWIALAVIAFGILLVLQRRRIRAAGSLLTSSTSTNTMTSQVIESSARPAGNRRMTTGGSRETSDPDLD